MSIPGHSLLTCPNRHIMTVVNKADLDKQERNQRTLCGPCQRKIDRSRSAYWCKRCKQPNGDMGIICNECYFENAPLTGPVIACMSKDCANMELPAISGVVSHEEIKAPMRLRSAMTEILKVHNTMIIAQIPSNLKILKKWRKMVHGMISRLRTKPL